MPTYAIAILAVGAIFASAMLVEMAYISRWMNKNEAEYQECRKECERGVRQDNHA